MATSSQPETQLITSDPPELSDPTCAVTPRFKWLTTTRFLITTNVLVFYFMLADSVHGTGVQKFLTPLFAGFDSGLLLKWGSDFGPLTLGGQYWRVITSNFLHWDFMHLALNMLFLWRLGKVLDVLFSRAQAIAIYLLTGAASCLLPLSWYPTINSAGASGAIYGQAGVLSALFVVARLDLVTTHKKSTVPWIVLMTFGLLHAAHLGGFLCGLVTGALLAQTLRMPQARRAARQRRVLALTTEVLVVIFAAVIGVHSDVVKQYRAELALRRDSATAGTTRVTQLFMNVKGSPRLVYRLRNFLSFELEDAGIAITNNQAEADAMIRGEVTAQIERTNIELGVIVIEISTKGKAEKMKFCAATMSTAGDADFFGHSVGNVAQRIRQKYPDARTVKLDPTSDMAVSKEFTSDLRGALKSSGFTLTESAAANLILGATLALQNAPIEKSVMNYKLSIVTPNGALLASESGSGVLFAKLADAARRVCPERFADLEWLYGNDPFFTVARSLATSLRKNNAKMPGDLASKPK